MNSIAFEKWAGMAWLSLVWFALPIRLGAEGIPEPSLVFYGAVRDATTGQRLTLGTLSWTFRPANGDPPVVVRSQLTNLLDQFSYVLFVPLESVLPGQPAHSNALTLANSPRLYDRTEVTIDGMTASLVPPATDSFGLGLLDRGRVEQVDLQITGSIIDTDGNGLPDTWEMAFFQMIGVDPEGDPDEDGVSNRDEWKGGTDPTDPQSLFQFIHFKHAVASGATLEWSSASNKVYSVLRSGTITGGFVPVKTGVVATPPINIYLDATALGTGPYFYLLQVEE